MRAKRIIPCLDMKDGRVVKGVRFEGLRDAGDPVELATRYDREGADELVMLDITATEEGRPTLLDAVRRVAAAISIPLTVGGGVRSEADAEALFAAGASKVSVGSAAVADPGLIERLAQRFGRERVVLAIDARRNPAMASGFEAVVRGGKVPTGRDAVEWAREGEARGAGELLVTSVDADGTRDGYDNGLNRAIVDAVGIPVIASGGAGSLEHLRDAFLEGGVDAVLAASIFHYGDVGIGEAKAYLRRHGIPVRGGDDA